MHAVAPLSFLKQNIFSSFLALLPSSKPSFYGIFSERNYVECSKPLIDRNASVDPIDSTSSTQATPSLIVVDPTDAPDS